jgi:hypothetical protein
LGFLKFGFTTANDQTFVSGAALSGLKVAITSSQEGCFDVPHFLDLKNHQFSMTAENDINDIENRKPQSAIWTFQ